MTTETSNSIGRRPVMILDALALLVMAVIWYYAAGYMFMKDLNPNGDNYYYLHLMQNMWEGNGYGTSYGGEFKPSNWFPPGYPLILLAERWLLGYNLISFKWVNLLFLLGTAWLVWGWLKDWLGERTLPLVIGVMLLLNAGLLHFGVQLMSEVPFMFFTVLAFRFIHKLQDVEPFWRSPYFYLALVSMALVFHIRGIGLALPAAFFVHQMLKKQWKLAVAMTLGFVLLAMPWSLRNQHHGLKGRYLETATTKNPWNPEEGSLETVEDWKEKLTKNAYDTMFRGSMEVTLPHLYPTTQEKHIWILGAMMLSLILFGLYMLGPMGRFLIIFMAANGAIFLMWHGGNYSRYVWPLAPVLYLGLFTGILTLVRWGSERLNIQYVSSFAFILLGLLFWNRTRLDQYHVNSQNPLNEGFQQYIAFGDSVKGDRLKDPMVVCRKPMIFHEHSGARTSRFPFTTDSLAMLEYFVKTDPDYIIIDNMGYNSAAKFLVPVLNKNPDLFYVDSEGKANSYLLRYRKEVGLAKLEQWKARAADTLARQD